MINNVYQNSMAHKQSGNQQISAGPYNISMINLNASTRRGGKHVNEYNLVH